MPMITKISAWEMMWCYSKHKYFLNEIIGHKVSYAGWSYYPRKTPNTHHVADENTFDPAEFYFLILSSDVSVFTHFSVGAVSKKIWVVHYVWNLFHKGINKRIFHYLFCVISTGLGLVLRIAKFAPTGTADWCLDVIAHSIVIYTHGLCFGRFCVKSRTFFSFCWKFLLLGRLQSFLLTNSNRRRDYCTNEVLINVVVHIHTCSNVCVSFRYVVPITHCTHYGIFFGGSWLLPFRLQTYPIRHSK